MNSSIPQKKLLRNDHGFTLMEVMISITLLVVISLSIFQATVQSYKIRDVLMYEGEFYGSIRLAMNILERDLALAYSPKMMLPPVDPTAPKLDQQDFTNKYGRDSEKQGKYWAPVTHTSGIRMSKFDGTEQSLSFVSTSHIRVYQDAKESVFNKIGYSLIPDSKAEGPLAGTKILVRTENANAFDLDKDDDKNLRTYPLLSGITQFKFIFYRKEKDKTDTRWNSDSPDQKNLFPDSVAVEFEVKGPMKLTFDGRYRFRLEIPVEGIVASF